jgi:hypothetical protein
MQRNGIAVSIALWLRKYTVTLLLIGTLLIALIKVHACGAGPVPQQPPEGHVTVKTRVSLSWNRGTRETPIMLQVAIDDPTFASPILEKKVSGTSHSLAKLESGKTYYWRLVQDDEPSPTASFEVSRYNVNL